jgi:hypothetical protein
MSVGMSTFLNNKILDAVGNNTALQIATPYIKLHIGDPGAAGTANPAAETTRKLVSFGAAGSSTISNDTDITWPGITGGEDATYWSLWDASTAGNFLGSGTITANAYLAGDTYVIPAGDLDISLTAAA